MKKFIPIIISLLVIPAQIQSSHKAKSQKKSSAHIIKAGLLTSAILLIASQNPVQAQPATSTIECHQVCATDLYGRDVELHVPLCKKEDALEVRNHMQKLLDMPLKEVEICTSTCTISERQRKSLLYCLNSVQEIKKGHVKRFKPASPMLFKRSYR